MTYERFKSIEFTKSQENLEIDQFIINHRTECSTFVLYNFVANSLIYLKRGFPDADIGMESMK